MGYTHYWTQKKDFSKNTWEQVRYDIRRIVEHAQRRQIRIGNGFGEPGSEPEFTEDKIWLNGINKEGCETFEVIRKRRPLEPWQKGHVQKGWSFCKTNRGAYDTVVTASLIYLASVHGYEIGSDGTYADWVAGLNLATEALPSYGLTIPLNVFTSEEKAS
jgi:hypothetical protein